MIDRMMIGFVGVIIIFNSLFAEDQNPVLSDSLIEESVSGDSLLTELSDKSIPVPGSDTLSAYPDTFIFRTVPNRAFQVGERLSFEISYGVIKAGLAKMEVISMDTLNERPIYRIRTQARSKPFFDNFFKVRDQAESIVDTEGLFTWSYEKHLREGSYKRDRIDRFDPVNERIYTKKDTLEAPRYTMDAMALLYYTRNVPLTVGDTFDLVNFEDGKVYPFSVQVLRKETVKVAAGKFDCIVIEPLVKEERLFKGQGKLTIWFSDDEKRLPVLMKSKVIVGTIDVELVDYKVPILKK